MIRNLRTGLTRSLGAGLYLFTEDEIDDIHLATLEVLDKTGVSVDVPEARELLDGVGARVETKSNRITFPQHVVEDAIRSAPRKFVACGRIPESDVVLERGRVGFTNFGEGIKIFDIHTREHRDTMKADIADAATLIDFLPNIDVYERAMLSHDVPHQVAALHNAEASLTHTTKHHFLGPVSGYLAKTVVEICAAIAGGMDALQKRPILSFLTCPVSPLQLVKDCCEIIIEGARSGIAVNVLSMAMAGGTSPVNLAGTLVVHNAEVLSGLVLSQAARKGAPVVYGSSTTAMDLRLGTAVVGTPECALINAAVARLARYYSLPCFVAGG